jgi:hypothetical protein
MFPEQQLHAEFLVALNGLDTEIVANYFYYILYDNKYLTLLQAKTTTAWS